MTVYIGSANRKTWSYVSRLLLPRFIFSRPNVLTWSKDRQISIEISVVIRRRLSIRCTDAEQTVPGANLNNEHSVFP